MSKSTLDRYVTARGKQIMKDGPYRQLPPGLNETAFVVASLDNLDKNASSSFRYDGKRAPDMHVTTVRDHGTEVHSTANPRERDRG